MSDVETEQKERAKTKKLMVSIGMEIDDNPVSTTTASAEFPYQKPRAGHTYKKEFKVLKTWLRRLFYILVVLLGGGWCYYKWSTKI